MNILFITPKYPPSKGGVETQAEMLAKEMGKKGHEVSVVTSIEGESGSGRYDGISVYRFPMPDTPLDYLNGYLFIRNNFKRILNLIKIVKIDIIHVHQFEMSVSIVHFLKRNIDIPVVVTVHSALSVDAEYLKLRATISEPLRWFLRIFPVRQIERTSISEADYVIAVSDRIQDFCFSIRGKTTELIRPVINLDDFKPDDSVPKVKHLILCSGRISPEKGQVVLVDALKRIDAYDANVLFLGDGKPADVQALKRRISDLGLNDSVTFVPAVSYVDVPDWYRTAEVVVVPSFSESFGLVALENMALGNIVIASDVGGLHTLIEYGKTGFLFNAGDSEYLATLIMRVFDNEFLQEMREFAIRKSREYDVHSSVDRIEKIYQGLIDV